MALRGTTLANAADGLLETALLGGDWGAGLADLASAAGARGATLVRHDPLDQLRSNRLSEFVLATESIAEPVREYLAGAAPPDPRLTRVNPSDRSGFLTDFDHFSEDEIRQNVFYEEFLRPRKLRWHACARVDASVEHGELYLSLKRSLHQEHYGPADIRALNHALPKVRMASAISRAVLLAEKTGMERSLEQRGEAVFELDGRGRVMGCNEPADHLLSGPLGLRGGELLAPLAEDQPNLERALAAPLTDPSKVACIVLRTSAPGRRLVVRTLPIVGAARDIFVATAALAIVTVWQKPDIPPAGLVQVLREAFGLTSAEARVTALVGLGVTLTESSRILDITIGTARNYFKAAQSKIGVSRQAELASLVALMHR